MEEILRQLTQSSNSYLNVLNVELSEFVQPYFQTTLEESAKRMIAEKRTSVSDINLAKQNINVLLSEMAKSKERQIGKSKDIVRFTALNESRMSICPLWPIC